MSYLHSRAKTFLEASASLRQESFVSRCASKRNGKRRLVRRQGRIWIIRGRGRQRNQDWRDDDLGVQRSGISRAHVGAALPLKSECFRIHCVNLRNVADRESLGVRARNGRLQHFDCAGNSTALERGDDCFENLEKGKEPSELARKRKRGLARRGGPSKSGGHPTRRDLARRRTARRISSSHSCHLRVRRLPVGFVRLAKVDEKNCPKKIVGEEKERKGKEKRIGTSRSQKSRYGE